MHGKIHLVGLLLLFPASLLGRTPPVPSVHPTIQAGIDAAAFGDTVLVACGAYLLHDIIIKSGICLLGETGDPDCVTIDAERQGRVRYCNRLYFSGTVATGTGIRSRRVYLARLVSGCTISHRRSVGVR